MKKSVIILSFLFFSCVSARESGIIDPDAGYDLRFGVISDTHVGGKGRDDSAYPLHQRFEKALNWYNTQNVKALAIVGDITEDGTQADWNLFKKIWENHKGRLQLIAVMGNHDAVGEKDTAAARFEKATGQKTNAHYMINGYHFIVLSAGKGNFIEQEASGGAIAAGRTEVPGSTTYTGDVVPPSVIEWTRTRINMAKEDAPGKPIFLFLHWPVQNTILRSDSAGATSFGSDYDTHFFKNDPEVIIFGGHTHLPNNEPRSIWQGGFTAVNTATLNYLGMEAGYLGSNSNGTANYSLPKIAEKAVGQGMIVSVKGSKVIIENYDFDMSEGPTPLNNVARIPQVWTFDVSNPADFLYTHTKREEQKTAPVFDESKPADAGLSGIIIRKIEKTAVEIEFPQAKIPDPNPGNEVVHSYRFDFINRQTGDIDRSARQWSDFMLTPRLQKPTYTQLIGSLKSNTEYELRIYAYGSFQECSSQYLTQIFRTTK
ncbi:MAG: metallophosphoesterase [Treponema sp.]|nr:metallophosphoesterase [Treponema sp.]